MSNGGETIDRFKSLSFDEMLKSGYMSGYKADRDRNGSLRFALSLDDVTTSVRDWQSATFGPPEARTGCTSRLEHLRREVEEAAASSKILDHSEQCPECSGVEDGHADLRDGQRGELASELADIGILWLSACAEAGMDPAVIMYRKLLINRERTWKEADAAGCIEHVEDDS